MNIANSQVNCKFNSDAERLDYVRRYIRRYVNLERPDPIIRIAEHRDGQIWFTLHDPDGSEYFRWYMPDNPKHIRKYWADGSPVLPMQGGAR